MKNVIGMLFLVLSASMIQGCVSGMPGQVKTNTSSFDGSKEITTEPGYVYKKSNDYFSGTDLGMGLSWTSKLDPEYFIVTVEVYDIVTISGKDSLKIKIGQELYELDSIDNLTQREVSKPSSYTSAISSKRYLIRKDLVRKMMEGNEVNVRVELSSSYVEGVFSLDRAGSAIRAFKNFLNTYQNMK